MVKKRKPTIDSKDPLRMRVYEYTQDRFADLSVEARRIVQQHGIPLEAPKGFVRFKLTSTWARQANLHSAIG